MPKVGPKVAAALWSLLEPESLAIMAGLNGVSVAANLTPFGWAADAVIAAIAFGFGGLAAIHALGDLVECFRLTAGAQSTQDLDAAGEALARAVAGLGVIGLMAVLHRVGTRKAGGASPVGAGKAGEQATWRELAAARAERLKARLKASQERAQARQAAEQAEQQRVAATDAAKMGTAKTVEVEFAGGTQPFTADLSNVTGKGAAARNRAIKAVINEDFQSLRLTHIPEYSPFIRWGV
jgi:hypothetical protein